jgi:HK97 gp10 family phage protein
MKFTVELEGTEQVIGVLNRFNAKASLRVSDAIKESAQEMAKRMRERVRVRSRKLRNSIRVSMAYDGLSAEVGPRLWRAHFEEFGTVHSPANPFVRPAFDQEQPNYIKRMEKALDRAARETGAK